MNKRRIPQQESAPVQAKKDNLKSMASPEFALNADPVHTKSSGTGTALPENVRGQMEQSMNADFSNVKVHTGSGKAEQAGALAVAQGNEVHFAQGQYNPASKTGQELLGHELAHVKQQQEGRVKANSVVGNLAVNDDASLEHEADKAGAAAANGKTAPIAGKAGGAPQAKKAAGNMEAQNAPAQCFRMRGSDQRRYPKFANFVREEMPKTINDSRLTKYIDQFGNNDQETKRDIAADVRFGVGPEIRPFAMKSNGSFRSNQDSDILRVKRGDISNYEKAQDHQQKFHELLLESSILHEYTHFLDDQDKEDIWGDEGKNMEKKAYGADMHNVHEAKLQSKARFPEGAYEVKVLQNCAGFPQRINVWGGLSGNGMHEGKVGNSFEISGKKVPRVRMEVEHHNGEDWKKSNMITTKEGPGKYLVRSEDWTDKDRNDLVMSVNKKK